MRSKAKGAARGGRPRRARADSIKQDRTGLEHHARPLTPYGADMLPWLRLWMLNEVQDDPEAIAEINEAFGELEAEAAALSSHGERVSDGTTASTTERPKVRERGGRKARAPRKGPT